MKRHAALIRLSHEHHRALVLARKLCRLESEDATSAQTTQQTADEVLNMWQTEIRAHFQEEEEVLLPIIARKHRFCISQQAERCTALIGAVVGMASLVAEGGVDEQLRGDPKAAHEDASGCGVQGFGFSVLADAEQHARELACAGECRRRGERVGGGFHRRSSKGGVRRAHLAVPLIIGPSFSAVASAMLFFLKSL
jgi:hypothetical protein